MEDTKELTQTLLRQEQTLQFATFSNDMALDLGLLLVNSAKREGKAISIDITRNGQVLFHHAMSGTANDHAEWIRSKKNVVARFAHSSHYIGVHYRSLGIDFDGMPHFDSKEYAAAGGFPVIMKNVGMVGTITVSGLPEAEDHTLLIGVLQAYLGAAPAQEQANEQP